MNQLKDIVGAERSLEGVCQAIHLSVVERHPQVVGAMHITCADESENECVSAFQRCFVKYMLPSLKFAQQSAFRIANLGGRYDWGAIRIAERHYVNSDGAGSRGMMVVKVNSHVGVLDRPGERTTYGILERSEPNPDVAAHYTHCSQEIRGLSWRTSPRSLYLKAQTAWQH